MSVECSIEEIPLHNGLFSVNTIELGFAGGKVLLEGRCSDDRCDSGKMTMPARRRRRGRTRLIRAEGRFVILPLQIGLFVVKAAELGLARRKILWIVDPRPRKGRLPNRR